MSLRRNFEREQAAVVRVVAHANAQERRMRAGQQGI
jgi:hypothetical protein